jgi:hypothetical protein
MLYTMLEARDFLLDPRNENIRAAALRAMDNVCKAGNPPSQASSLFGYPTVNNDSEAFKRVLLLLLMRSPEEFTRCPFLYSYILNDPKGNVMGRVSAKHMERLAEEQIRWQLHEADFSLNIEEDGDDERL